MPSCRRCREDFAPGTTFCPRCGGKLGSPQASLFVTTVVVICSIFACLVLFTFLFGRGGTRSRPQGQLTACKSNLKNIGTALEMYSTDNKGVFPLTTARLTPDYLKVIPTCPSVGRDTYTSGFKSATRPDAYTVVCNGTHHGEVNQGENFPQYTSTAGLISQ